MSRETSGADTRANRWFWRCTDCLSIVAVEREFTMKDYARRENGSVYIKCECGGAMGLMGKVKRNHLVLTHERCACDSRCTHATGPNCDCSCNGANHGTGRVVTIVTDEGGIPMLRGADLEVAAEFRAAKSAAKERIAGLPFADEYRRGICVPRDAWDRLREAERSYRVACRYRTHKRRIAALGSLLSSDAGVKP